MKAQRIVFPIKVALDRSLNTIHSGMLLALHKGYYKEAGLNVEFVSPDTENPKVTPVRRLVRRRVDFAIAPSESVIAHNTGRKPVPVTSVATMLQRDTTAIVSLKSSGLDRPAQFDGRGYASFNIRFEEGIVRKLVINDGGRGSLESVKIGRLEIWEMLKKGEADIGWIYIPWEGVDGRQKGLDFNIFRMKDYDIPYGYTPLLLAHRAAIPGRRDAYQKFLRATAKAYEEVAQNPEQAASFLHQKVDHKAFNDPFFLKASLKELQPSILDENEKWGMMNKKVWGAFTNWLLERHLLKLNEPLDVSLLYDLSLIRAIHKEKKKS